MTKERIDMDVRNCKSCGKLFQYIGKPLCPACSKKMEDKFNEVRDYIRDNPTVNMSQVSEELDVPIQQIKRWVREERLAFSKDSGITISCENCGKPILTGRFCKECKSSMRNNLSQMYGTENVAKKQKKEAANPNGKMRFLKN